MKKTLPKLTLVLGGAASGKSTWAEAAARRSGLDPVYFATAEALDAEMADKIARHRQARGPDWRTVECPLALASALRSELGAGEVAVVDCLTLWLTNQILAEADLDQEIADLLDAFADAPAPVIAVSNEVGAGIVPADALSRRFRNQQGYLNQRAASHADLVVVMAAGLPMAFKGSLPS